MSAPSVARTLELDEVVDRAHERGRCEFVQPLRLGAQYMARYAAWVICDRTINPPQAPGEMHPMLAKGLREVVLDEAAFRSRLPRPFTALAAPSTAAITATLTSAGLGEHEVHAWFRRRRRELGGRSAALLIELVGEPGAQRALELASADTRQLGAACA